MLAASRKWAWPAPQPLIAQRSDSQTHRGERARSPASPSAGNPPVTQICARRGVWRSVPLGEQNGGCARVLPNVSLLRVMPSGRCLLVAHRLDAVRPGSSVRARRGSVVTRARGPAGRSQSSRSRRSLIHSTHTGIKRPKVPAHASGCYCGCGCPLNIRALSGPARAVTVTMGEHLRSDGAGRPKLFPAM